MSNTYTGSVDATTFVFTTQPATFFPDDRQGAMVEIDTLPSGASIDNIFFFDSPTSGKYLSRIIEGSIRAANCGIYTSNLATLNNTRLNAALAHPDISTVVFDDPKGGSFNLSGSITGHKKTFVFRNNNFITGTNTIDEIVVDCHLKEQCFTIGTTLSNSTSVLNEFSTEHFGAVGNGSDETLILQWTSDTIIQNPTMPRTLKLFAHKTYGTQGWILHNWNGTEYDQFSIAINGEPNAFAGNPAYCAKIKCLNPNGFGINIQRATGTSIKGIIGEGCLIVASATDTIEFYKRDYWTYASTGNPVNVSDKQYAPHAFIVTEAFRMTNSLPADGGYADWNGSAGPTAMNPAGVNWYRGGGIEQRAGSIGVTIEDISSNGFVVGFLCSPNGETQQSEDIVIRNWYGNNGKCVFAFCQRESKGCFIYGGESIDRINTVIDGRSYGAQQGTLPNMTGYTTAGSVKRFVLASAQHSLSFKDIYCENLFQIGAMYANPGMTEFRSCTFSFNVERPEPGLSNIYPDYHLDGFNTHFEGCVLRFYDDLFNKRLIIFGYGHTANKCFFDVPPITTAGHDFTGIQKLVGMHVTNSYWGTGINNLFGFPVLKGLLLVRQDNSIASGHITVEQGTPELYGSSMEIYECGGYDEASFRFHPGDGSGSFTVDAASHTATVILRQPYINIAGYIPGQYFLAYNDASVTKMYVLGKISEINILPDFADSTILLVDVPITVPDGAGFTDRWIVSDFNRLKSRFTGDYTNGSSSITNVFGAVMINEVDTWSGFRITNYDPGTGIADLSKNFAGISNVGLYSGAVKPNRKEEIIYERDLPPDYGGGFNLLDRTKYFPGDIWTWYRSDVGKIKYKCTVSGYLFPAVGEKQSVWKQIDPASVFLQTATGTSDFSVIIKAGTLIRGWLYSPRGVNMTITAGTTNFGTDKDPGTSIIDGTDTPFYSGFYASIDTTIYFNGITGSGGQLYLNFF